MKFKTATIVANPKKRIAVETKGSVVEFLRKNKIKIMKHGEILITLGGDGTLLYNREKFGQPVFGIGNEKSFICQSNFRNWRKKLAELLSGYRLEKRMMLECEIDGRKYKRALNEVVVRSRDHRVVELVLFVGNRKFEFKADGVILATPTGSTAYAYSCGAPELSKKTKKYVVVAIAPYRRAFKPLVVDEKTKCSFYLKEGNADLVIDGQFVHPIELGVKIKVKKSSEYAQLAQPK